MGTKQSGKQIYKSTSKKSDININQTRQKSQKSVNTPVCTVSKKCGACQLSNMDYTRQLNYKQAVVVKLLRRFGHVNKIIGMAYPYHYRNKAQYTVRKAGNGNLITGVYQSSTGGIVATDDCFINDGKANEIARDIRKLMISHKISPFNPQNDRGLIRHIMVRKSSATGDYMVVLVCSSNESKILSPLAEELIKKHNEIKTIVLNVNKSSKMMLGSLEQPLYGNGFIEDILCGKRFRISSKSFYQVNSVQTEVLYTTAIEYANLTGKERVLDAYCGVGTIGLIASDKAKQVVGVELNSAAVLDAKENSALNNTQNTVFYNADAAAFMREAAEVGDKFDVVMIDPPRAGCNRDFLQSLVSLSPSKVVYVSCNPQTLSRDLYFLVHNGYKAEKIQPIDMFPHTNHVECVVLMSRVKK
ncbi:MAG: 23S rRNA (uracil(1939)-C(5))-methyltransferase RlmD [Lachnospiraceae bacterium]|nr:23S rRNA (uracil(1939)-C(5))-methyltransferase RlmD [Lachnospiraceae bacterium]